MMIAVTDYKFAHGTSFGFYIEITSEYVCPLKSIFLVNFIFNYSLLNIQFSYFQVLKSKDFASWVRVRKMYCKFDSNMVMLAHRPIIFAV